MKTLIPIVFLSAVAICVGQVPDDNYVLTTGKACGIEGSAVKAEVKAVNRLKSRTKAPTADDIDTEVTLATMLAPGEDETRFDQTKAARVVAFVVNVKPGGKETCNCQAANPIDKDTHIELGLSPDVPENQRVIVEVTPRLRKQMKDATPPVDWRTLTLQSQGDNGIKGKWVEITGWLMFDVEHVPEAENTNPGGPKNWRATCWEIHPITEIKVLGGPPANMPALAPSTLRVFQNAHAIHARRDPARRDVIEKRNKAARDNFAEETEEPPK
jgi:hypothetical protein